MQVPPEIAFRHIEPTEELKDRIHEGIRSLEEVYDGIICCRVMVEETNPARRAGKLNHVRLDITVPRGEIVVNRKPPEHPATQDLTQAIGEAFDTARRQLIEFKRVQRGEVKTPGLPPHGRIIRLMRDQISSRYGFIETGDGKELYFHENAVVGMDYDDMDEGMEVRYAEGEGENGPQASTVGPLHEHAIGPRHDKEIPLKPGPD